MVQKEEKLKEALKELAAEFFNRESNRTSLITITNVELKSHNTKAVIQISVLPRDQEPAALDFLHRKLGDFRKYVSEHLRVMYVPFFEVAIDQGEKNRQRIEEIS